MKKIFENFFATRLKNAHSRCLPHEGTFARRTSHCTLTIEDTFIRYFPCMRENGYVYTIEGNYDDSCAQGIYSIGYFEILGYGIPAY